MLARDIDIGTDLEVKRREQFQDFLDRKEDVRRHCLSFKRLSSYSWLLVLNTGTAYVYKPASRKLTGFNSDHYMFMDSVDGLINFIIKRETKAFNKIIAARAVRAKFDKQNNRSGDIS